MAMARLSVDERREQFVRAAITVMSQEGLDRATTRRIAEVAGAPQAALHYAFRDKEELLVAVVGEVTGEVERILRAAVDPGGGLEAAVRSASAAFWDHVVGDDGLQLMQYELSIHCRRTPGLEWLAEWQYNRYVMVAQDVFATAADADPSVDDVDVAALSRFIVAATDGLILQYEMHHDRAVSSADAELVVQAAMGLVRLAGTAQGSVSAAAARLSRR
jgi:AcrR family transcriptional regulator